MDGHLLDSESERQVDDWLFKHGIEHEVHPPVEGTPYFADWKVAGRYIELFGLAPFHEYQKRMFVKMATYERLGLPIIALFGTTMKSFSNALEPLVAEELR